MIDEAERIADEPEQARAFAINWLNVHNLPDIGRELEKLGFVDVINTRLMLRIVAAALRSPEPAQADPVQEYFIRKGTRYFLPNVRGFTNSKAEAGRYTLEEAINYTHPNGPNGPRDGLSYEPAHPLAQAKPHCSTCGKDVPEVLCPTCAKWWNDNPPAEPAQAELAEAQKEIERLRAAFQPVLNALADIYADEACDAMSEVGGYVFGDVMTDAYDNACSAIKRRRMMTHPPAQTDQQPPEDVEKMIEGLKAGISIAPRIDECKAANKTMAEAAALLRTLSADLRGRNMELITLHGEIIEMSGQNARLKALLDEAQDVVARVRPYVAHVVEAENTEFNRRDLVALDAFRAAVDAGDQGDQVTAGERG